MSDHVKLMLAKWRAAQGERNASLCRAMALSQKHRPGARLMEFAVFSRYARREHRAWLDYARAAAWSQMPAKEIEV